MTIALNFQFQKKWDLKKTIQIPSKSSKSNKKSGAKSWEELRKELKSSRTRWTSCWRARDTWGLRTPPSWSRCRPVTRKLRDSIPPTREDKHSTMLRRTSAQTRFNRSMSCIPASWDLLATCLVSLTSKLFQVLLKGCMQTTMICRKIIKSWLGN